MIVYLLINMVIGNVRKNKRPYRYSETLILRSLIIGSKTNLYYKAIRYISTNLIIIWFATQKHFVERKILLKDVTLAFFLLCQNKCFT